METTLNKTAWREAATGGLWLGVVFCGLLGLGYLWRENAGLALLASMLQFAVLFVLPFLYTRKLAGFYGTAGFTYTQGLSFIIRLMLFAGVITGLGQFILQNYVDPEYYREVTEKSAVIWKFSSEQLEAMLVAMRNPLLMILGGIFSMVLYGGLMGLFVAVFTKRQPDPFGGDAPKQTGGDQNT